MALASVAFQLLVLGAGLIGMSFGVLLPIVFPGACFGAILAVLIGFFDPNFTVKYMVCVCPFLLCIWALIGTK